MKIFTRRLALLGIGAALLPSAGQAQSPGAAAALERAQAAKTLPEALTALGVANAEPGKRLLLEVPDIVAAGRSLSIKVTSKMPGTDWIALFAERGPGPLLELKEFSPGVDLSLSASIKLEQTTRVRAVVRSGGKFYQVSREIKVATPERPSR